MQQYLQVLTLPKQPPNRMGQWLVHLEWHSGALGSPKDRGWWGATPFVALSSCYYTRQQATAM